MKFLIDPLRRGLEGASKAWRRRSTPSHDLEEAIARNAEAHDILRSALLTMMEARIQTPREAKDRTDEDRDDIC